MDVLTFETCWAVYSEIIKQVTSSWFYLYSTNQDDTRSNKHKIYVKMFGRRALLPAHNMLSCLFSKTRRSWRPCTIPSPIQNRAVRFLSSRSGRQSRRDAMQFGGQPSRLWRMDRVHLEVKVGHTRNFEAACFSTIYQIIRRHIS